MHFRAVHATGGGQGAYMLLMIDYRSGSSLDPGTLRGRAFTVEQDTPIDYTNGQCYKSRSTITSPICDTLRLPKLFPSPFDRSFDMEERYFDVWDAINYHTSYYRYESLLFNSMTLLDPKLSEQGSYTFAIHATLECPPDPNDDALQKCDPAKSHYYDALHRVVIDVKTGMPNFEKTIDSPLFYAYREVDLKHQYPFFMASDGHTICSREQCVQNTSIGEARTAAILTNVEAHDVRTRTAYYDSQQFGNEDVSVNLYPDGFDSTKVHSHHIYADKTSQSDETISVYCVWDGCTIVSHLTGNRIAAIPFESNSPIVVDAGAGKAPRGTLLEYQERLNAFTWVGSDYRVYRYDWQTELVTALAVFPHEQYNDASAIPFLRIWTAPPHLEQEDFLYLLVRLDDKRHTTEDKQEYCEHHIVRLAYDGGAQEGQAPITIARFNGECEDNIKRHFAVLPLEEAGYTGYASLQNSGAGDNPSGAGSNSGSMSSHGMSFIMILIGPGVFLLAIFLLLP